MAGGLNIFKLSVLLNLLAGGQNYLEQPSEQAVGKFPPSCNRIECPSYELVHAGNGFEIRRYNSSVWTSTAPIMDISLYEATRNGFLQLFKYIQGKNKYHQKIEMTAPVITQIAPSDGPICESSFTVSFYLPKQNQQNPPPAENLKTQIWGPTYAAIKQFPGFVSHYDVGELAASLLTSLEGTVWSEAIKKGREERKESPATAYTVAQYNSPFEFTGRVNEIWLLFDME